MADLDLDNLHAVVFQNTDPGHPARLEFDALVQRVREAEEVRVAHEADLDAAGKVIARDGKRIASLEHGIRKAVHAAEEMAAMPTGDWGEKLLAEYNVEDDE